MSDSSLQAKLDRVDSLKRDDQVRLYYDVSRSKSAVYRVVSVSPAEVRVASFSAVSRYSREHLASVLAD